MLMKLCRIVFLRVILSIVLLTSAVMPWVVSASHNPVYAANNTYYVSKNGSDNNPGSLAQPWLTIQKAASTMVAGDTVNIQAGTYNEKVSPAKSGSAGSPITYQTYGSGSVVLDGTGKATGSTGVFDIENKNYITLKGIQIQSSNFAGVFVYGTSDHIILQNLTIHDTAISGICAVSSGWSTPCTVTNLTIDGCTIYATNSTANQEMISLTAVNGFEIKNCVVHDAKTDRVGIDVKVGSGNGSIHDNEVYNTGARSNNIYVDAAGKATSNISIYNNNVHSGHGAGIVVNDERGGATVSNIHIYNNLLTGNLRGIAINNSGQSSSVYSNIIIDFNTLYNNGSMSEIWFLTSKISNSAVRNNLIYNTSGATLLSGVPGGVTSDHNLTSNPQFVSTTDSHLRSTSPAINAASSVNAPTTDFAGNARPQGSGYDIGAYEYGSTISPGVVVLDHVTVSPSSASVGSGSKQTYTAQGYDSSNNPIGGLTYTWSVNNPSAGSINSGGVFTAGTTGGSYPNAIQAISGNKTGIASVIVNTTSTPSQTTTGTLAVTCSISGANILVGGVSTPTGTYPNKAPGTYIWSASATGYASQTGSVAITANQTTTLAITLLPVSGTAGTFGYKSVSGNTTDGGGDSTMLFFYSTGYKGPSSGRAVSMSLLVTNNDGAKAHNVRMAIYTKTGSTYTKVAETGAINVAAGAKKVWVTGSLLTQIALSAQTYYLVWQPDNDNIEIWYDASAGTNNDVPNTYGIGLPTAFSSPVANESRQLGIYVTY